MKKFALILIGLILTLTIAFAQEPSKSKVVKRISIRHADPALILLLLSGQSSTATPPEISTIRNAPGGGNGGFGGSGFGGSGGRGGFGGGR